MTLTEIKKCLNEAIDEYAEEIIKTGEEVLQMPELGYCEEKTSAYVRSVFDKLGIEYEYPLALTGVKARLKGRSHERNVCIIGELDAVKCSGHPNEGARGAAHACGHHAQIAAMLGTAAVLKKSGVMRYIDGDVIFIAAPAEEFIDLEYRKGLRDKGKIRYFGGKQQLIAEGVFDNVDMAMMVHAQGNEEAAKLFVRGHNLGFIAKTVTFKGRAAHGSTPFEGINALNAAALFILGIHANRETFREEERIRIHPIITKGGDVVNSVPDEVCVETYVRGATIEAINKGDKAVERAAKGACGMVGADVEFENTAGYLPIAESAELSAVFENNAKESAGSESLVYGEEITGSTDIGDLSRLIPVIQPSVGGFAGGLHSTDFKAVERSAAYILPARIMSCTVAELLYDNATKAENVIKNFKPDLTKNEYIKYLNREA